MTSQTRPYGPKPRPAPVPSGAAGASVPAHPASHRYLGRIIAGSLTTGIVTALLLATAPFVPADEDGVTGAVLIGFAVGWAMLAALSTRYTSAPQRWAAAPAAFMSLSGLTLLTLGSAVHPGLDWIWPPAALLLAAWTTRRVRRLPSRSGRRQLLAVVALLALASVGAGYQTVAQAADSRALSMPGRLVDVGGHRLHLTCTGSGTPTVVLEPGAGEMAANLGWITPAVARSTRVCAYDRAGRGWSDPAGAPQSGARIADDLHTLLHRAGVPGPYVLAGHSFGGLYVLTFADRYPDEVAGMVLVDTTAPTTTDAPSTARTEDEGDTLRRVSALLSTTSRLGLGRLYAGSAFGDLPEQARADVRASAATPGTVRSTLDEYLMGSASMRDAAALTSFGDKPLAVLTAGANSSATWLTAQDRLAALSTNTVHHIVDGATHEDLVAVQQYAAITSRAISDVVISARTGQPINR
ncbi:alpha/beta hydrolase [Couchioplanes caeruleus]|uniref:alpha/beta hydrolase n=1 Tax=Couchioplanes caeruleus TaxID=56438 RepID=UPI0020BFB0C5|nr:alpha/beta hydrolase [Couchioplanes caeruleus]UQU67602.1 alpha/beta hydrolase [Couchioplanes caeruleus]